MVLGWCWDGVGNHTMVLVLEGECTADHIGVKKCWLVLIGVDFWQLTVCGHETARKRFLAFLVNQKKIPDHQKRKNAKLIVAVCYATCCPVLLWNIAFLF